MSVLLNRQCCATCEHWMGKRESGKSVRCENVENRGHSAGKKDALRWRG